MLTDSRSILSMTRHELFRRVLCDAIGRDVDEGRIPADIDWCSTVVRDICVDNAVRYFSLPASWVGLMAHRSCGIGDADRAISTDELREIVDEIAATEIVAAGARRVLLVPPDLTRLHSRAGEITGLLFEASVRGRLRGRGAARARARTRR